MTQDRCAVRLIGEADASWCWSATADILDPRPLPTRASAGPSVPQLAERSSSNESSIEALITVYKYYFTTPTRATGS